MNAVCNANCNPRQRVSIQPPHARERIQKVHLCFQAARAASAVDAGLRIALMVTLTTDEDDVNDVGDKCDPGEHIGATVTPPTSARSWGCRQRV